MLVVTPVDLFKFKKKKKVVATYFGISYIYKIKVVKFILQNKLVKC